MRPFPCASGNLIVAGRSGHKDAFFWDESFEKLSAVDSVAFYGSLCRQFRPPEQFH
jgi:hypothetical protein